MDPPGVNGSVTYGYDPVGNRLNRSSSVAGVQSESSTYDANDRLTSDTYDNNGNTTSANGNNYAYDFENHLTRLNGGSVDYGYDAMNRLASVKDNTLPAAADTTAYTYDNANHLHSYSYPNGITTSFSFNSLNRLTALTIGNGQMSLAAYNYTLGPAGNRTAVAELGGRSATCTYDDLYRLKSESISNDPQAVNGTVNYSYDPVGNRLSRASSIGPVQSQASTYDANDRLTSDGYDNNGNTISSSGAAYGYDFENRLTSVNGGVATFVYDGDGNRVAKTANGITTRYLIDTNNPTGYAQVVDEVTGTQVTRSYTYGQSLVSQRQLVNNQWQVNFYGYDGQGSVRLLTDINGAITDTYTYDAFGNRIAATGNTPNERLYAGEQFDATVGFYYLRARYLNPSSGRFWNMDSFEGSPADPASLHKYLYAGADPVNKIDPSGHMTIAVAFDTFSNLTIQTMSGLRNLAIAAVIACTLNFAVTGLLNELDIPTGAPLPCDAPNKPEKKIGFVHGTSFASALAINTIGVEYEGILGGGQGDTHWPGAFFTFLTEPNRPLAAELAYSFALRKEPPRALIEGKLPVSVFARLQSIGAVQTTPLTGSELPETIFYPRSFRALNYYNRGKWLITPMP